MEENLPLPGSPASWAPCMLDFSCGIALLSTLNGRENTQPMKCQPLCFVKGLKQRESKTTPQHQKTHNILLIFIPQTTHAGTETGIVLKGHLSSVPWVCFVFHRRATRQGSDGSWPQEVCGDKSWWLTQGSNRSWAVLHRHRADRKKRNKCQPRNFLIVKEIHQRLEKSRWQQKVVVHERSWDHC